MKFINPSFQTFYFYQGVSSCKFIFCPLYGLLLSNPALLCALLLAACNAKVIEPIRLVSTPGSAPARMASDTAEPRAVNYGVPGASSVSFSPNAHQQVVDLTY